MSRAPSSNRVRRSWGVALAALVLCLLAAASSSAALVDSNWQKLAPSTEPSARYGAGIAALPGKEQIVLFGGSEKDFNALSDTWTYEAGSWSQQPVGVHPSARAAAAMAGDLSSGKALIFGGYPSGTGEDLRDTWVWNGESWSQQFPSVSPPRRNSAAMAEDPVTHQVVLFGGFQDNGSYPANRLSDTWIWDGSTWKEATPAHVPPSRGGPNMAFDPATEQLVLFTSGNTWTWDGSDWTNKNPATSPSGRYAAAMAYDGKSEELILYGGVESQAFQDTWSWNGSNWKKRDPKTSPSSPYEPAMATDPTTGTPLLFGGGAVGGGVFARAGTWSFQSFDQPTAQVVSPAGGGNYRAGESVATAFKCTAATGEPAIESCTDSGGSTTGTGVLDTTTVGPHTYSVVARAQNGAEGEASIAYTVAKAKPSLTVQASAATAVGGQASAAADLGGGFKPGGTIVFRAYGPDDASCTGTAAYTSEAVKVSGDGSYGSAPAFAPSDPGTYRFVATYSGDAGNESVESLCGEEGAAVKVAKATTTTAIEVTPSSTVRGEAVTIGARVAGASPTGTVTFRDGDTVLGTAPLGSAATASLTTTALPAGARRLRVEYQGDARNLPSTSPEAIETVSEPPAPPRPEPTPSPAPAPPAPPKPQVSIDYGPNRAHDPNPKGGPRYTFVFSDRDPGTTFYCRLDKAAFKPCTSPTVLRHLKRGRHVFVVKSVDAAGVESPPVKETFFVGARRRR